MKIFYALHRKERRLNEWWKMKEGIITFLYEATVNLDLFNKFMAQKYKNPMITDFVFP
jgi:hypothetical protein